MLLALLASSLTTAGSAPVGTTITVPTDVPTIQGAIDIASFGDEIVVEPGSYPETLDLLGKDIVLRSSSGPDVTFVDGAGLGDTILLADSGETFSTTIEGLTFVNGEGRLRQTCSSAVPMAGAVYIGSGNALTFRDCVFRENGAAGNLVTGAAIYLQGSSIDLEGCVFERNGDAPFGGAIGSCGGDPGQSVRMVDCLFTENESSFGAGANLEGIDVVDVRDCVFRENTAGFGAGLYLQGTGTTEIRDCVYRDNTADHGGGVIFFPESQFAWSLVVERTVFANNEASFGGGLNVTGDRNTLGTAGAITIADCDFIDNGAGFGGGLSASTAVDTTSRGQDPTITIRDSRFHGNLADSSCCLTGDYITECHRDGFTNGRYFGGAADLRTVYGGTIEVVNCIADGNDATRAGGFHLSTCGGGTVRVVNSTVANNGTSGIHVREKIAMSEQNPAEVRIENTIVTGNGASAADEIRAFVNSDPNISFDTRYSLVRGGFAGTGNIDADPLFQDAELGAYCLQPGSPAIDAGDNGALPMGISTDYRGNARFVDDPDTLDTGLGAAPIVDMGAYEFNGSECSLGSTYCGPAVANSTGLPGALRITGTGYAPDDLRLAASDLPVSSFGYFLVSPNQGSVFPSGSAGELCVDNPVGRFSRPGEIRQADANGRFDLVIRTTDLPLGLGPIEPGETWNFQGWYRDLGPTSNFTEAITIDF